MFKRALIISLTLLLPYSLSAVTHAESENAASTVYLIRVDGEIHAGTSQFVQRAVETASANTNSVLLIELNTPGGMLNPTQDIVDAIMEDRIETIVYVSKPGSFAYSAGTFILLAANHAAVHPNASIGAAQPRILGLGEEDVDPKIIEATKTWVKGIASERERSENIVEQFVTDNLTLSGSEALEKGVIDFAPSDRNELLQELDLETARFLEINPNILERVLSIIALPQLVSLFLSIGALGLIFAIRSGEFELLAPIAAIALFVGLWGIGSINISTLGVILMIIGVLLVAWEIMDPGFGVTGVLGTITLIAGAITFGNEPFRGTEGFFTVTDYFVIGVGIAGLILFLAFSKAIMKIMHLMPQTGAESLVGKEATVIETLNPVGAVRLDGERWSARLTDNKSKVKTGQKVNVEKLEGNTLIVREP